MNILVIGSGGREHALAWKLQQSPDAARIFCAPGNAGTEEVGENVAIPAEDLPSLLRFAKENQIGLTVVGPDGPLAAGVVDLFAAEGLRIFGPTQAAARLESSKIFAKNLMRRHQIPTALAGTFDDSEAAVRFCARLHFPIVLKADGLALGKGVTIAQNPAEAAAAIDSLMTQRRFGEAGRRIVVEEFLRGSECSLHALVDGSGYRMLATARDHKRAHDGDTGANTGGMGALSPADNWNDELQTRFERETMGPLLRALPECGATYRGLLFPGIMICSNGLRILEFNCRFGDPEAQVILPRLRSDLLALLEATIDGTLEGAKIEWDERVAVTVVLASGGYPGSYETGKQITGLEECAGSPDVQVFHAGTRRETDRLVTAGGRVLAITALAETLAAARARAYEAVAHVHFEGCHYRRDIALTPVAAKAAGH